ncbi:MAG: hypothetical protein JST25_10795 [Actinobacteria bacterium]|nr:hypothetical protein [Actinomycetota bacterium]
MSDHREVNDGAHAAPVGRDMAALEVRLARDSAIPHAVFAAPWFGHDRAGFGLVAGRNKIIEVSTGAGGRELRVGRFTGKRRRITTVAGVAKELEISVADTERMLDRAERALRAGIAAYEDTYRAPEAEPAQAHEVPATAQLTETGQGSQAAAPATSSRTIGYQVAREFGAQPRPLTPDSRRALPPFPDAHPGRDDPGHRGGPSL